MTETTTTTTTFENATCSRCGGSGNYSYCSMYSTRCFKCGGAGKVYTKRGAAAKMFYESLLSKPASELQVGMKIWESGTMFSKAGWAVIEKIEDNSVTKNGGAHIVDGVWLYEGLNITTKLMRHCITPATQVFRVAHSAAEKQEAMRKALEFQATLTKAGTVRVSSAKKSSKATKLVCAVCDGKRVVWVNDADGGGLDKEECIACAETAVA